MSSPFSRVLPSNPDLAQQGRQAKELLARFAAGDSESQARVRAALPDKQRITLADAQFVIAREYGFVNWPALKQHIESVTQAGQSPVARMHEAFNRRDARAVRQLFESHPELRARIDEPAFSFNQPAIVAFANDPAMVQVLLDFGANPNRRSDWWAGGFHALYVATGEAADRLLAAGAIPDACAAAHLDRPDLLAQLIADDPACVHQRGGDGQTPLHFATSRRVIDLLVAAGADLEARDTDHRATAAQWMLDHARGAGRYDLAQYLVQRGAAADIFLVAALGLSDRAQAMLERAPELLELRTGRGDYGEQPPSSYHIYFWTIGDGRSPLEVAAQFEQHDTLRVMTGFASPLRRFLLACGLGNEQAARALLREHPHLLASMKPEDHRIISDAAWRGDTAKVSLMLDLGFDPRATGEGSGSALHCASWQGFSETVRVLLQDERARALLPVKDAQFQNTPLGWCCHGSLHGDTSRDHAGVAELLLEAGAKLGKDTTSASPSVEAVLATARRASRGR
jgi:ankyrin repeat protein